MTVRKKRTTLAEKNLAANIRPRFAAAAHKARSAVLSGKGGRFNVCRDEDGPFQDSHVDVMFYRGKMTVETVAFGFLISKFETRAKVPRLGPVGNEELQKWVVEGPEHVVREARRAVRSLLGSGATMMAVHSFVESVRVPRTR